MPLRNPLSSLLDYASQRGNEAASIGSVMTQLARPILVSQGVETGAAPPAPQAKTGGGVPAAPLPKTTSDAEEYYIREFQKRGMSRPASEGIVAGMGSESGLNPAINERNPVVPGSRGGFGLYQLTGPRRIAFERWASENGKNVNDDQAQIDFMMTEFAGPERKAYDALIQAPDAQSAATIFTDAFLRPGVSHATQSANQAARMSGQPYDPAMAGAGAMAATGGALPQTVEGILSSLYPDSTEAEKAAHRKDIWRGLSQGLSAMSQGRQVDLSNIAANADERRRQYVLDAKEREKAKVAASMVYSQSGDANLAAGIASGAISYSDYLNDRQVKNAERIAQETRLKDAATTDALYAAAKAAGVSAEKLALIKTGDTAALNTYDKLVTDQQLLDKQAKDEEKRAATLERLGQSADPLDQATFAYMVDADLPFAEARKLAQTDLKPEITTLSPGEIAVNTNTNETIATGAEIAPDVTAAQNEAKDLFTQGAVNPDTGKPFTSYAEALVWKLNSGGSDTNVEVYTGTEGQAVPPAWAEAEKGLVENGQMFVRKLNPETNQFEFVLGQDGMPTIMDIPGGEAAAKRKEAEDTAAADAQKAADRQVIAATTADTILRAGKDILKDTADWTDAPMNAWTNYLSAKINPYGEPATVASNLQTMKDLVSLAKITEMQNASPTGSAGLGPATQIEGDKLAKTFGALDPNTRPDIFREQVSAAMNAYNDAVHGTQEEILQLYKDGKISAEVADAMSTRYVVRGAGVDPSAETMGTMTNLGLSNSRETVLGTLSDQDIAPKAIAKLGPDYKNALKDPAFFDEGGPFSELSKSEQDEVERLMEVMEND